jgi:NAD(P)-dependent dehydrogenase (short-subunit alcohol dehydrogenase family)
MPDLKDQIVIVTGGAQGIGKGIARCLLGEGAGVVMADIDREAGRECVSDFNNPKNLIFVRTDVSNEKSVAACIRSTLKRFGKLDALVNNAGISDPGHRPIEEATLADWERVLRTNLTGCFLTAKHAAPHLRQTRGAIVNLASTRALQSEPHTEAYSASKGGVVALTHALALSLGPHVRVNCISPGWIDVKAWKRKKLRTDSNLREIDHRQHPAGRVGAPDDIAAMVAYLISKKAAFITGQNFIIDGGMTRKMIYAD